MAIKYGASTHKLDRIETVDKENLIQREYFTHG